jgi:hypothetical protein
MCFAEQTIPRFLHGGPFVRHYGSSMGQEETAIGETFLVTGHLRHSISFRQDGTSAAAFERTSRFVYVSRKLLDIHWHYSSSEQGIV